LQTSRYLGAEAYYARGRTNSQEARRNSCHLHLHQVVMWGRIMLLHVAVWGGIVGQPKLHFLTHPLLLSTTTTLKTLFAFCGGTLFLSTRYEECHEFLSTSQKSFPKFVLINIPKVLSVYQKCKLVPLMFPKALEFIF
jgi:hypothetical protein